MLITVTFWMPADGQIRAERRLCDLIAERAAQATGTGTIGAGPYAVMGVLVEGSGGAAGGGGRDAG
jgi:hypothetical protein